MTVALRTAEVGDYPINAQVYLAGMDAQHGFVRDGDGASA
jgi:hypothetical protein